MPNIHSLNIKEKIKLFDCRNPLTNAREIWRLGTKNEWKLDASKCAFCSKICRESPWIFISPRERNTGCTTCTWRSPWNEMGVAQPVFRLGLELKGHRQRWIYRCDMLMGYEHYTEWYLSWLVSNRGWYEKTPSCLNNSGSCRRIFSLPGTKLDATLIKHMMCSLNVMLDHLYTSRME